MGQHLDSDSAWNAAKTAINAYEHEPSATNAELVTAAVWSIRCLKEDARQVAVQEPAATEQTIRVAK